MKLIGRKAEKDTFQHCLDSDESKLVAVYGRRRVGKTFLVRQFFGSKIKFEVAGLHQGDLNEQLLHFAASLAKQGWQEAALYQPDSWKKAFDMLERFMDTWKGRTKKVVFLDELPWFDTPKSRFLTAFESFWNSYCTRRTDIVCVICGSAASWMTKKILKNKGGLHNRVSEKIRLTQFSLRETEAFLREKSILWSRYDMAQLYFVTGGVPYYLDAIRKGESVSQFIDRACFSKDGILAEEYQVLFSSLFDSSERHYKVVEALYNVKRGLKRNEIIEKTTMPSGGALSQTLQELEESGFVDMVIPYNANLSKGLYKLTDNFTIFYLKFMKHNAPKSGNNWATIVRSQSWVSWSGLAFERVCFAHVPQIRRALKLEAISCIIAPWETTIDDSGGAQIDMVIDRADRVVHLCEIKFVKADFTIDKAYAQKLRNQLHLFTESNQNHRKSLFLTLLTPFGVTHNEYYRELVQSELTLEDLFE